MTTPLNLTARAKGASLTGFSLKDAIGEALGYASMCWSETPSGVFESTAAAAIVDDLHMAVAAFLTGAINAQGLDAELGMADWKVVELIAQEHRMGYESEMHSPDTNHANGSQA